MTYEIKLWVKDELVGTYISNEIPRIGEMLDFNTYTITSGRILLKIETIVRFIPGNYINIRCIKI